MKPRYLLTIAALALMVYSMTGCVTTSTTLPDGTTIRRTEPAIGSVETAAAVALEVIDEK